MNPIDSAKVKLACAKIDESIAAWSMTAYYVTSGSTIELRFRMKTGKRKVTAYTRYGNQKPGKIIAAVMLAATAPNEWEVQVAVAEAVEKHPMYMKMYADAVSKATGLKEAEVKVAATQDRLSKESYKRGLENLELMMKQYDFVEEDVISVFKKVQVSKVMES